MAGRVVDGVLLMQFVVGLGEAGLVRDLYMFK